MFFGSIWAGTLLTLMWLPGGNNVREPALGRAVPVLDLPAKWGLISLNFGSRGGLYLCKDAVNRVGKGPAA